MSRLSRAGPSSASEGPAHRRHRSADPPEALPSAPLEWGASGSVGSLSAKRPAALQLEPLRLAGPPPLLPPSPPPLDPHPVVVHRGARSLDLRFENVSCSAPSGFFGTDASPILQGVSGEMRAGELTAIMGPSGAGKTTLMNILAGYVTRWSGSVFINGSPRDLRRFRRQSCYIMQDDHLQPLLSVQEAMTSAANLKLGSKVTLKERQANIKQILVAIGLYKSRKVRTGSLSGGQKKRLSIALELVSNPPVMFFDEPTSGLDSSSSKQCVALLGKLALEGRTVICTIHQPSALILELFDHLYALADGKCIYQGSIKDIVSYLKELDIQCPPYHNPADFLIDIATGEYGPHLDELVIKSENGRNEDWRRKYTDVAQIKSAMRIEEMMANGLITPIKEKIFPMTPISAKAKNISENKSPLVSKLPIKKKSVINPGALCKDEERYPNSFFTQVKVLLLRNIKMLTRDRVLTYMRFFMHISVAFLMGAVYSQIGKEANHIRDNFNYIFFTIMFLMFTAFSSMTLTFPIEVTIVTREHFNRWYSLKAYYVATTLTDAPIQILSTLMYIIITYTMTGQPFELFRFVYFSTICFLVSFVAQGLGLFNGAVFNIQNGVIFGPLFLMPFTIFSGFFIHLKDAHPYLQWLFHISYLKYGLEGAMQSLLGYNREKLACNATYCHYRYPSTFLKEISMDNASFPVSVIVLSILCLLIRVLTYYVLSYRLRQKHR